MKGMCKKLYAGQVTDSLLEMCYINSYTINQIVYVFTERLVRNIALLL